ncbi:MAG: glycogen/starch synthase [Candidatus Omnitrophota bacterium]
MPRPKLKNRTLSLFCAIIFLSVSTFPCDTVIFQLKNPSAKAQCLRNQATKNSPKLDEDIAKEIEEETWIGKNAQELIGKTIATVSMEGNIIKLPERLRAASTNGGLGAYQGDKYEGLAKIGANAFGVQPLYTRKREQFIEGFCHPEPRQGIKYVECFNESTLKDLIDDKILEKVCDLTVRAWDEKDPNNMDKTYDIEAYKITNGIVPVYLFYNKELFDDLYTDKKVHRFTQEVIFGRAFAKLIDWFIKNGYKADGKNPLKHLDILHMNEAHVVSTAANLKASKRYNNTAVVYTNHTNVPAGLEIFEVDINQPDRFKLPVSMDRAFAQIFNDFDELKKDTFLLDVLRSHFMKDKTMDFCQAALSMCDVFNCVSKEHAIRADEIFQNKYPHIKKQPIPVLNGSGDIWVLDDILEMEKKGQEPGLDDVWRIHQKGREKAFGIITDRLKTISGIDEVLGKEDYPDPNKLTAWLCRRMVIYKNQHPMLKDIIDVMCANKGAPVPTKFWGEQKGLGMQVVVSGIAHEYNPEEDWIKEFLKWMKKPGLKGRFFYVPNFDTKILEAQSIGSDICINIPEKEQEACGTSDQRSARNFGINIATKSGGPPEYIKEVNEETGEGSGFLMEPITTHNPHAHALDRWCGDSPWHLLQKLMIASKMYYAFAKPFDPENKGIIKNIKNIKDIKDIEDTRWLNAMLNSYRASKHVTSEAMEQRYARDVYVPALRIRSRLVSKAFDTAA